ncbi:hypothetical protein BD560DRAFT_389307 [Blakeslea trispora]|nr:hypothetical protein BD560DRAFT_389307 [Blakeslea trispora]
MTLVPPINTGELSQTTVLPTSDESKPSITARRGSLASMPEESISLEAYAEADGIDLKKLTPKERRQLRNKISARNFRVRRKEYISTLEGQVNDHKKAAEALREKLIQAEEENKKLRKEMDSLKRQNQILQQQKNSTTLSPVSPRIPKPNLNKDISILGTKATDSYRQQDNCILVSNAVMPAWDYHAILSNKIEKPRTPSYMNYLVGQFLLSVVQLASSMPCETKPDDNDCNLPPLMPDDRDFTSSDEKKPSSNTLPLAAYNLNNLSTSVYLSSLPSFSSLSSLSHIEELYDTLIQSALINNSTADKSFCWWDHNPSQTM